MIRWTAMTVSALLVLAGPLAAQQDDRWQLALDDGGYIWDIRLVNLDGDSLVVRQSDSLVRVPVAHINEVRLIRKSEMEMGGGGATAGAMSALVGGDDEVYDLTTLEFADRLRTIQKILLLHPTAP
jgi:hypothetical protein